MPEVDDDDASVPFLLDSSLLHPNNESILLTQSPVKNGENHNRSSIEMLTVLADVAREEQDKMIDLIDKIRQDENPVAVSISSDFRLRRLTYGQKDGEETISFFSPVKCSNNITPSASSSSKSAAVVTTIFASSEIGTTPTLKGKIKPPFPAHVMGTYSCHGIEPTMEDEDDLLEEGEEELDEQDTHHSTHSAFNIRRRNVTQKINQV